MPPCLAQHLRRCLKALTEPTASIGTQAQTVGSREADRQLSTRARTAIWHVRTPGSHENSSRDGLCQGPVTESDQTLTMLSSHGVWVVLVLVLVLVRFFPLDLRSMSLLDSIDDPKDLLRLDEGQLEVLAGEIRSFLIDHMSHTGGHLSPNLGVVELTLALHRIFDSPKDRILFDVGHQAYTHKLITGRRELFGGLRQDGGLSGYPNPAESKHDFVENSHSSTSLSYAMGMAKARDNEDDFVIAVIGDGALTGGMAYEALNHIAQEKPKGLIIVLNDNGRSYAPTVGGLAEHLSRLRVDHRYEDAKQALGRMLGKLPVVGDLAEEAAVRMKDTLKEMVQPLTFFDVLGLKYTGPINGHNLALLEETFTKAKEFEEPVVIHITTEKGRGYGPAILDEKEKLHGVGKFEIATGKPLSNGFTMTQVFESALLEIADADPSIVAVTAAMQSPTGLNAMAAKYPDRVFDVGICEQHAVTMAAGLAMGGKHPVVSIYSTFMQRALDQVTYDVALHKQPVTFVLDRAGVTGPDGPSHHGMFDLSFLRMVPGMVVGAPSTEQELGEMLTALTQHDGPGSIRYPKAVATSIPTGPFEPTPIGQWEELHTGSDVLILAVGSMVEPAQKAVGSLAEAGIAATLINARWVKPMDDRLPAWAAAHPHIVTVEDNIVTGGFGAGVSEALSQASVATPLTMLGIPPDFLRFGNPASIRDEIGLTEDGIVETVILALSHEAQSEK